MLDFPLSEVMERTDSPSWGSKAFSSTIIENPIVMSGHTLYPLNTQQFSDEVIGVVLQRSKPQSANFVKERTLCMTIIQKSQPRCWLQSPASPKCQEVTGCLPLCKEHFPSAEPPSLIENSLQIQNLSAKKQQSVHSLISTEAPGESIQTVKTMVEAKLVLGRERRRLHQTRYRLKQRKLIAELESTVQRLHRGVHELLPVVQRGRLDSVHCTHWGIVAEYFRLFRNGHLALEPSRGDLHPRETAEQRDFLHAATTRDIVGDAGFGVEAIRMSWAFASRCYPCIDMKLKRLERDTASSLIATMECTITISEDTLCYAFPHLMNEDQEVKLSPIALKLLGKRIVVHGSTRFGWDDEGGQMTSLHYNADMLTPVIQLVGNLEDACCVFSQARITIDGKCLIEDA